MSADTGHLGTLLLDEGLVTPEILETGMALQDETGRPLGLQTGEFL